MNSALFVIILVAFFLLLFFFFAVDVVTFVLLLFVYSSVPTKCIYIVRILAKSCACTWEVANLISPKKEIDFGGATFGRRWTRHITRITLFHQKKKKKTDRKENPVQYLACS